MDISQFIAPDTGQLVRISGIRDAEHAFVPAPLPPVWEWPEVLWPLLMAAHRALASLDGIGTYLPEPQLILRPLQFREAVRSSSLEGTYTQPVQQALFEFDPAAVAGDEPTMDSYREISNYGRALRLYFETTDRLTLSLHLIRQLHYILLEGVRGGNQDPGGFRQIQNQIGRPPRYVPPPPDHMLDCLNDFERYLTLDIGQYAPFHTPLDHGQYNAIYDPLVNAFLVHYQFEAIHPFLDGNGRVGRLLLSIMIAESCRMSVPWLQMSPYFDANKDEYIDRLFEVSTKAGWNEWIEFCLIGVVQQAEDTHARCVKLLTIQQDFKSRLSEVGGNLSLLAIVDDLFRVPVLNAPFVAEKYGVSYPTARSYIDTLVRADIVTEWPHKSRPKTFVCPRILDIIYE